jgi:hypothetical protein
LIGLVKITIPSRGASGNGWRHTFSPFLPIVGAVHHPRPRFDRDRFDSAQNHQPFLNGKRRY